MWQAGRALARAGQSEACEQLTAALRAAGHEPNPNTFHFRAVALVEAGRYPEAKTVCDYVVPNAVTYALLARL